MIKVRYDKAQADWMAVKGKAESDRIRGLVTNCQFGYWLLESTAGALHKKLAAAPVRPRAAVEADIKIQQARLAEPKSRQVVCPTDVATQDTEAILSALKEELTRSKD